MRFPTLLLLSLALATAPAGAVEIDRAMTRYFTPEQFKTVGEYLTGQPNEGPRLVLRSQPQERAGLYFILELGGDRGVLHVDTMVEIEVIRSDSKETYRHHFFLGSEKVPRGVLYVGLTGQDWPSEKLQPMAWRARLLTLDGEELAGWKSFLWEMPTARP